MLLPVELELLVLFLIKHRVKGFDVDIGHKPLAGQDIDGGGNNFRRIIVQAVGQAALVRKNRELHPRADRHRLV